MTPKQFYEIDPSICSGDTFGGPIKQGVDKPDADLVVLASKVLDALEVEGLDDALAAEVELGAAWRRR